MITIEDVIQARETISRYLLPTPLIPDYVLSERLGRRVWLKAEMFQQTGSFKARGALHWVKTASPEELGNGLGAVSAGNHALGLAWAAGAAGTPVTIVMPENASPVKVDGARKMGAEVILHGDINDAWALMQELVGARGVRVG
ncbi:MAG: pyridoxal-phosphate dependent enzyme [Ectothiorhodospiraceae bacterium]|nr:pyridoxal-phosphate dependent enzyme [Ectothiorhodospiraceae bacterium]